MRTGVSPKRIATRKVLVVLLLVPLPVTLGNAPHYLALGQALICPSVSPHPRKQAYGLLLTNVHALALWQLDSNPALTSSLRKEVIQPHLPIRLPCYDFTPVIRPAFDGSFLAVRPPASGISDSHGVTGGVYKTRERIHRGVLIRDY